MPKPATSPTSASFTARSPAAPVSWRIASVMPRKPPAHPAWPAESWPPLVLFGKSPSCASERVRTNAGLRVQVVAVDEPAAAQQHRVVGEGVVPLDGAAHEHVGEAEVAGAGLAH